MTDIPHHEVPGCDCQRCFLVSLIEESRVRFRRLEKELMLLDKAQRPTPADMAKQITAHPGEPGYINAECHCVSCDANRASRAAAVIPGK